MRSFFFLTLLFPSRILPFWGAFACCTPDWFLNLPLFLLIQAITRGYYQVSLSLLVFICICLNFRFVCVCVYTESCKAFLDITSNRHTSSPPKNAFPFQEAWSSSFLRHYTMSATYFSGLECWLKNDTTVEILVFVPFLFVFTNVSRTCAPAPTSYLSLACSRLKTN